MIFPASTVLNRRRFMQKSVLAGGALLTGVESFAGLLPFQTGKTEPSSEKKLGIVDFANEAAVPLQRAFGAELDGRMYADLAQLTPETPRNPTASFYIRTRASDLLAQQNLTSIQIDGLVQQPSSLPVQEISRSKKPMGLHLMECAGNARIIHFGLMSVAEWSGVLISDVLDNSRPKSEATRIMVSGFDEYRRSSNSSLPGASWVFRLDELKSAGAFLATEMNGEPLTADHGAPVRLFVPGWYGCTCIKWVNRITLVDDSVEATLQMQEYASRTLQNGVPQLALDFQPAMIDQAAMPIRVEKWGSGDRIFYRVIGILWGGSTPVKRLEIQFNPDLEYVTVDSVHQRFNDPWSFWMHTWKPKKAGTYDIRLRVKEPQVSARRLDAGFYLRTVQITEAS